MEYIDHVIFTNDNNISLKLLDHPFSAEFKKRVDNEHLFRKINTFLIKNNIIKNNIIDLGAWIGDNSMPWAKNIDGIVYAIDPSPDNCAFMKQMSKLNNITNIKVVQSAISNVNEVLSTDYNINHCAFNRGKNKANAVSLDYLYTIDVIENIGYIHLDVEGMEFKVLEGSINIIDIYKPIITFEQHLGYDNTAVIILLLSSKQYTCFLIDEIMPGCFPNCRNFIAFPNTVSLNPLIENINNHIGFPILMHASVDD